MPAAPSMMTLENVEPLGHVTNKVVGLLPTEAGKNTEALNVPLPLVKALVAGRLVAKPPLNTEKLTAALALLLVLVQFPEIMVLAPGAGLALKAKALIAAAPMLATEENTAELEQVALKVACPVLAVAGIITLSENVPVELKLTVPKVKLLPLLPVRVSTAVPVPPELPQAPVKL